ncbi:MAG: acyl-CoA dehydrogenase family protein [Candidatus Melainabacteria bacterium]|nr:acyl-CoA dehydrogenase family protein [Candidatus Melainabacteria bacterium]
MTSVKDDSKDASFAETAMQLAGKTEEEAKRTGAVDRTDDEVDSFFAEQYKTSNSPVHRAIWEAKVPVELFSTPKLNGESMNLPAMKKSLEVLARHKKNGTMLDGDGKISKAVLDELAKAGYWGMLIEQKYGGQGGTARQFMTFLTQVASIEPTAAGLASVHGCIGAVDPVRYFGSEEQRQRLLPKLASGEALSAFALTEPQAGSDLTALKTKAELDGDHYVVNGEKLFITNAIAGRTIGLVCLVDGKPAALIADLPKEENDEFQIIPYKLHALKHAFNNGLKFKNFKVPKENLLVPTTGDGLTVAYHGLNMGRLALCATASGVMRIMLANMLPWAKFRDTYGNAIETRELVKRRIARAAALICGADALVAWGSWLLDQGYRGELECIIAKIFGSEAEKECAIELFMKTHGGRSFLAGHLLGDNIHDFLAPCIYEGEGEMLGMAFFKSLAKQHGVTYFEPIGKAIPRAGLKKFNPMNPLHGFALRNELVPYAFWWMGKQLEGVDSHEIPGMSQELKAHVDFALEFLSDTPLELSQAMVKHQLKLADRQCRIAEMSQRAQDAIIILVTALWAHNEKNSVIEAAADILCQDLRCKLTGERPSDSYFKAASKLADQIIDGKFPGLSEVAVQDILFKYDKPVKEKA